MIVTWLGARCGTGHAGLTGTEACIRNIASSNCVHMTSFCCHGTPVLRIAFAIVAFLHHTLLALDDGLYALQPSITHLPRSELHRCLQRHNISRLPDVCRG